MLKHWGHKLEQLAETTNISSSSVAKLAVLIECGFASFSSKSGKVNTDITQFLPFQYITNSTVSDDTAYAFWECYDNEVIPDYFKVALIKNESLFKTLKNKKELIK